MRRRANRLMGGGRIVLWDAFTDADGTLLTQHAPDGGAPWTASVAAGGALQVSQFETNRLSQPATAGSDIVWSASRLRRKNGRVAADIVRVAAGTPAQGAGIGFRGVIAANGATPRWGYVAQYAPSAGSWQIQRNVSTQIGTNASQALTIGQTYRLALECRGSVVMLWVDGVLLRSVDDAGQTARGTRVGTRLIATAAAYVMRLDNWMCTR